MEGISFAMFLSSECVMNSTNPMPHLATKKKRVPYFPLNPGYLIGILKMVYQNNPHIINWVGFNPLYMFQVPGPPPTPPAMVMVITHQPPSPCGMGGPWEGAGVSQPPTNSNVTGRIR